VAVDCTKAREVVERNFPGLWFVVEAILSVIATLFIEDIINPASLFLIGAASSSKGTVLDMLRGLIRIYWSDEFTPSAFVSETANKTEDELKKIDLLPRIKDKALVVPELAPIFGARSDVLKKTISVLTRVLDGEGYTRDAATAGNRGYLGPHRFVFLGASTPFEDHVWRILGKLGNRLCILVMPETDDDDFPKDFSRVLREEKSVKEKLEEARVVVCDVLDQLESLKVVDWDREKDPQEVVEKISLLAELSGGLRGNIQRVRCDNGQYERGFKQIESPKRFTILLYNIARGRALVNGRMNIDDSDLELVREIALSSCPYGRYRLMKFLISNGGEVETIAVEELLGCSKAYALDLMRDLEELGVVNVFERTPPQGGRIKMIQLKPEYKAVLLP